MWNPDCQGPCDCPGGDTCKHGVWVGERCFSCEACSCPAHTNHYSPCVCSCDHGDGD